MAEERVSYLEPIDEESVAEAFRSDHGVAGNMPERPMSPESHPERASESDNEATYQKILAATQSSRVSDDVSGINDDAKQVSLAMDADSKVRQLSDLAQTKGVVHAIKVARRLQDFYVLDRLHDDLANRLHQSLKERGLIAE